MTIELRETVNTAPVKKGNRWRTIVATPGQGSSGYYSTEVLKRDAEKIVPPGGQSFINHDISRNPKDLIGVFPEGSFWSEEDNAVVGDLEVFSHWKEFVTEVAPHVGMSLFALGEADSDGNITSIVEDVMNGCDLVARAGLNGSKLDKLYESAILAGSEKKPSTTVVREERNNMELEAKVDKALEILAGLVAEKSAQDVAKVQAEADETAVATAIEAYDAAVKAVEEADLFKSQRGAILAEAKKGADVTSLIETAKSVKAEALEAVALQEETAGRVITSDSKGFSLAKIAEAR